MRESLASRLGDIPGVSSVVVDLDNFGRGIDVRLEPGADEVAVMERLRSLLAAYGIRSERQPLADSGYVTRAPSDVGVDVTISPADGGARIEAATEAVRSFRVVAAEPVAVAQGLADAWCQVIGRLPIEISAVEVAEDGTLTIFGFDGEHELKGSRDAEGGWLEALTASVGEVIGDAQRSHLRRAAS